MTATARRGVRGNPAAPVQLRAGVFDAKCEDLGLTNEGDRAAFLGSDRSTLYRLRRHLVTPSGEVITRWAQRLGIPVEELWEASDVADR